MLQAADSHNLEACYKVGYHYFFEIDGFEDNLERSAHYFGQVLRSGDTKVLRKFQELFHQFVLASAQEVIRPECLQNFAMLAKELQKIGIDLNEYLHKDYGYDDSSKLSETEQGFLSAAEKGNEEEIKKYLEAGGNPFVKGDFDVTALHKAAFNKHAGVVAILLDYYRRYDFPVDPVEWKRKDTPLSFACLENAVDVMKLLLNAGAKPFKEYDSRGSMVLSRLRACSKSFQKQH